MKNKRWLALAMGTLMAVSVTACGSSQAVETKAGSEAKTQNVKLVFMNGKPELDDAIKDLLSLSYELTAPKKRNLKSSGKNPGDFANGKEKEIDEG